MSKEYDLVSIASGDQFLIETEDCLYAGAYNVLKLHEELEVVAYEAVKDSNVSIGNIERHVQAVTADLVAITISDGKNIIGVTWLGE